MCKWRQVSQLHQQARLYMELADAELAEAIAALQEVQIRLNNADRNVEELKREIQKNHTAN